MNERLALLYKELEFFLNNAPCEEDCSKEENQVYSDMANLKCSMEDTGIKSYDTEEEECIGSKENKTSVLGVDAYEISKNIFEVRMINGKVITVERKPKLKGKRWEYRVDTQYFCQYSYAQSYIRELIHEKLTGIRYIYHTKRKAPDICGNGKACRSEECDRMLCTDCPVAEEFHAKHDNVSIEYVIR